MEYKQPKYEYSVRPNLNPSKYSVNKGAFKHGDHDLDTMYCPWCEQWTSTFYKRGQPWESMNFKWHDCLNPCSWIFAFFTLIFCSSDFIPKKWVYCSICNRTLARRENDNGSKTWYYLPVGDGFLSVLGGRNEVIALSQRSTLQSIRLAKKSANILTAYWLSWYQDRKPWEKANSAFLKKRRLPYHLPVDFYPWIPPMWRENFSSEAFSHEELVARAVDAMALSVQYKPECFLSNEMLLSEESNNPWIRMAANFINKELGPGPELCKAWREMYEDFKPRIVPGSHHGWMEKETLEGVVMPNLKADYDFWSE